MLDRRLQILVDQERWWELEREAQRRGTSVAVLVPEAASKRRASLRAILDADPMDVPDPDHIHAEMEALRSHRA